MAIKFGHSPSNDFTAHCTDVLIGPIALRGSTSELLAIARYRARASGSMRGKGYSLVIFIVRVLVAFGAVFDRSTVLEGIRSTVS